MQRVDQFSGEVVVVTGAATGLGRAIAEAFDACGATTVLADIDLARAEEVAECMSDRAIAIRLDVTDEIAVCELVAAVEARVGRIHVLVSCAGIIESQPMPELTAQSIRRVFEVNVIGILLMMREVVSSMIAHGTCGRIINLASVAGRRGAPASYQYAGSKAAVISITQSAALELAKIIFESMRLRPDLFKPKCGIVYARI